MEGFGRRRYLQATGAAATGLLTTTAGCSALDGVFGSRSGDVRPLVAHPGWFDPSEYDVVEKRQDVVIVNYEESAALREHSEKLPDFLVESENLFGLDAAVDRYVYTIRGYDVLVVEYVDEEALATAVTESDDFRTVPGVEDYHGRIVDHSLVVVGAKTVMGVGLSEGTKADRSADELLAGYARLLRNRPSSFNAGTENLDRLNRLYDAVKPATMGAFELAHSEGQPLAGRAEAFHVESDRTTVRIAGVADDPDPQAFEEREVEHPNKDFSGYEDVEVSKSGGLVVLTGTTPTEEFEALAPE